MKRIITFVVTAFYAVTASAQEKTGLLGDLINKGNEKLTDIAKEQSGWNSLVEWFDQLVLWPEPLGGTIAFAMVFYGLTRFKKKLTRIEYIGALFVGWVAGISLTWFNIVGWGWATLLIPVVYNLFYQTEFVAKRLRGTWLEKLDRGRPERRSLAERVQALTSGESQSLEKCPNPNCGKMSLGSKFCTAGCGYQRPIAGSTPTSLPARPPEQQRRREKGDVRRTEGSKKSRNLAEARRKVRDAF